MESQTRFDLTRALENWRTELSSLPSLTPDSARELETHLRDAITGFQQRGLNEEESFWLARRRVGQPEQLVTEFAKADPAAVWRERGLWMAVTVLAVSLWNTSVNAVLNLKLINNYLNHWVTPGMPRQTMWQNLELLVMLFGLLLRILPLFVVAVYLLRGRGQMFRRAAFLFQSRRRFVLAAGGWLALNEASQMSNWLPPFAHASVNQLTALWPNLLFNSIWPLMLIILIAKFLPAQNGKTGQIA